jgi:hypothetical protein
VRILLILVAFIVVAVGAVLYYVAQNLDSIVENAIEAYGSELTGTAVRVASVEIALTEGRGTIRGLRIANPSGFSSGDAFSLGEITLAIDPSSVTDEPYGITTLRILAPAVNAEFDARARTNIDAIRKNVDAYVGGGGGGEEPTSGGGGPAPRITIGDLRFEDGKLAADTTALGGKPVDVKLPGLRLRNLGGANGQPADVIGKQVVAAYTQVVAKTVAQAVAGEEANELIDKHIGGREGEALKGILGGARQ